MTRSNQLGNKSIERDAKRLAVLQQVAATVGSPGDHGSLTGLGDDDHTQYLLANGGRTLTGNMAVAAGVTIDGVDLSAHAAAADAHHDPVTVDASLSLTGQQVSLPAPGTLTAATANSAAGPHTHAITASSSPGAAASLLKTAADGGLTLDHATISNALGVGGNINLTGDLLHTADLTIEASGGDILIQNTDLQTDDWVSGSTGWGIQQDGSADFRNLTADQLTVDAIISDINLALAGTEIITKSLATVSRDFTVASSATLYVYDLPGAPDTAVFESGDWVRLRYYDISGGTIEDCWGTVSSYSDLANGEQSWTWTKQSGTNGRIIRTGMIALDYGQSGDGFIKSTVQDDAGAPYIDITTWDTDPSDSANLAVQVRLGNLAGEGFAGYGLAAGRGAVVMNDGGLLLNDISASMRLLQKGSVRGTIGLTAGNKARIAAMTVTPTNLANTGSFETDAESWTAVAYSTLTRVTSEHFQGSACLNITYTKQALDTEFAYAESPFFTISGSAAFVALMTKPDSNAYDSGEIWAVWKTSSGGSEVQSDLITALYSPDPGSEWAEAAAVLEKPVGATGFVIRVGDFTPITPGGAVGGLYLDFVRVYNASSADHSYLDVGPTAVTVTSDALETSNDVNVGGDVNVSGGIILGNSGAAGTADQLRLYSGATPMGQLSVDATYFYLNKDLAKPVYTPQNFYTGGNASVGGGLSVGYPLVAPTDEQIRLYNGTTLMGQLSTTDTTWLRINQDVAKDIYTPRNIATSGRMLVGHTDTSASAGDVVHAGALVSRKSSVNYTGYAITPLTTKLTSTSWDGDNKTAANNGTIDLSAVFGAPAGIKAVLVRFAISSGTLGSYAYIGPSSSNLALGDEIKATSRLHECYGIVPCDASGDVYFLASGTIAVYLEIFGYLI